MAQNFNLGGIAQYLTVNTSSNVITSNATLNAVSHTTGATGTGTGGISANVTTLWVGNNTINTTITSAGLTVNGTAVVANSTGVYSNNYYYSNGTAFSSGGTTESIISMMQGIT